MTRTAIALLSILLCVVAVCAAGDNPAVGKWNCVSTDSVGTQVAWVLVVTHEAGKLSGSITIGQSGDSITILEPVLAGNVLTFKVSINPDENVELTGRIEGSKIEGTFKGKSSGDGTFKGTRQP